MNVFLLKCALLPHEYARIPAGCGCVAALWFCNQEPHYTDSAQKSPLPVIMALHHSVSFGWRAHLTSPPSSIWVICEGLRAGGAAVLEMVLNGVSAALVQREPH